MNARGSFVTKKTRIGFVPLICLKYYLKKKMVHSTQLQPIPDLNGCCEVIRDPFC